MVRLCLLAKFSTADLSYIDNQLLYFSNKGEKFIPRTFFIKKSNSSRGKRLNEITQKVRSCRIPDYNAILKINKAPLKGREKMAKTFKENCIYVMSKDIYDKEALKRTFKRRCA